MKESAFQHQLIGELKARFPGCLVLKNDEQYIQGIPDLMVLWGTHWAALECKASKGASHRPNQDWYVERLRQMSFAAFISPENKEEVLDEISQAWGAGGPARVSRRKQVSLDQL